MESLKPIFFEKVDCDYREISEIAAFSYFYTHRVLVPGTHFMFFVLITPASAKALLLETLTEVIQLTVIEKNEHLKINISQYFLSTKQLLPNWNHETSNRRKKPMIFKYFFYCFKGKKLLTQHFMMTVEIMTRIAENLHEFGQQNLTKLLAVISFSDYQDSSVLKKFKNCSIEYPLKLKRCSLKP